MALVMYHGALMEATPDGPSSLLTGVEALGRTGFEVRNPVMASHPEVPGATGHVALVGGSADLPMVQGPEFVPPAEA